MNLSNDALETLSQILWRCFAIGFFLMLVWAGALFLPGNFLCGIHGSLVGMTQRECVLINYSGLALFKLALLVFFLFPWIAIKLVLRNRRDK